MAYKKRKKHTTEERQTEGDAGSGQDESADHERDKAPQEAKDHHNGDGKDHHNPPAPWLPWDQNGKNKQSEG